MTKNIQTITIILLLTIGRQTFSQTCQDYNRKLFYSLPKNFPDKINCKDDKGNKQGWWIYYEKSYRTKYIPNEGDSGEYVSSYNYGQFKNNIKIGDWTTVMNVHQIYDLRVDNYYYGKDTILIKSGYWGGGWFESTTYYNADSSIIKYKVIYDKETKEICIDCNRRKNKFDSSCKMTYRNKLILTFPHDKFGLESERATFMYEFEKKQIDDSYK
ncbi:hypothetical protein [Aurantibacillus circumpalustris]|uniref:hypothetical protein n=1 Tax=Aurantibacillus circumpalustris TaxID=3036359 RepID=UPI00295B1B69|nr:hypothetical protein [Aurantibacillus circumpalustris]